MQAFVPKSRKPRFEFTLKIIDLNNVPLSNGTAYVKWSLPAGTSTEHRGHTDKAMIQEHKAWWDYEKVVHVRMTVDRNQTLQEYDLQLNVIQEFSSVGGRGERILLGNVRLNLAEYVDKSDDDEVITRRYLMQESKVNSTLKLGIGMHQIEGDRNFITPPLRSAMVFGGIAGVVSSEQGQGDPDDLGRVPSINIKSRETGDLQDMYRRTLAASWSCRAGELPPDQLVEDIFAGGAGWAPAAQSSRSERPGRGDFGEVSSISDGDSRRTIQNNRLSPYPAGRPKSSSGASSPLDSKGGEISSGSESPGSRGSISQQLYDSTTGKKWKNRGAAPEVSEFDVREDLRSWEVSVKD